MLLTILMFINCLLLGGFVWVCLKTPQPCSRCDKVQLYTKTIDLAVSQGSERMRRL